MKPMEFKGRWVLVTGASSGLGKEIARVLAREHNANLVLVARRGAILRELAAELEGQVGVQVKVIEADLSREADVERVYSESIAIGSIYGVVLNAGVTHFGEHLDLSWSAFQQMLAINVTSVVRLTTLFVPYLIAQRNEGGIMLVASMAGLMPVPYQSAYSGTKAFLVQFGRSLWHELRRQPISITTFAPGGIHTDMTESAGLSVHFGNSMAMMNPDECARTALRGFIRRDYLHVPGFLNRAATVMLKVLPQRLIVGAVASEYRKALAAANERSAAKPG